MTISLHSTNRPITASDQASPVAIATTITSASGGSPSDWFAHSDITPLQKPMTAAIGIGSGEPLSENAPDPFADSGPSIFLQDDQPFAHDPDFYNGHGAPNPFAEAAGSAGLHGAVAHLSRVQEVFVQGIDEGEHQSESKTLEEQSARSDTRNKKRNLEQDIKAGVSAAKKKFKEAVIFIKENNLNPVEAGLKSGLSIEASARHYPKQSAKSRFKGLTQKMHASVKSMKVRMAEAMPSASPLKVFFRTKAAFREIESLDLSPPMELPPSPSMYNVPADSSLSNEVVSAAPASVAPDDVPGKNAVESAEEAWDPIGYVKEEVSQREEIFFACILLICFENEQILMSGFQYLDYVRPQEQINIAVFAVVDYLDVAATMFSSQGGSVNHG